MPPNNINANILKKYKKSDFDSSVYNYDNEQVKFIHLM